MLPAAPGRFSTTTCCLRPSPRRCAAWRAARSGALPGMKGTIKWTGFSGYSARATPTGRARTANASQALHRMRISLVVDRLGARHGRMAEAAASKDGLASAEGGNARRLIAARQPIDRLGIDDGAQRHLTIRHEAAVARVLAEITSLFGIGG